MLSLRTLSGQWRDRVMAQSMIFAAAQVSNGLQTLVPRVAGAGPSVSDYLRIVDNYVKVRPHAHPLARCRLMSQDIVYDRRMTADPVLRERRTLISKL